MSRHVVFAVVSFIVAATPARAQSSNGAPPEPAVAPVPPAAAPVVAAPSGTQEAARAAPAFEHGDAATAFREGAMLPFTLAPRVGAQYVTALALGGYDGAPGEGARFHGVVEGSIAERVALRVGFDYYGGSTAGAVSAGARVNILRQEKHGIDLGVWAQYSNRGFHDSGEIDLAISLGRRWGKLSMMGNLVYGQGLALQHHDAQISAAFIYRVHPRVDLGFDGRLDLDLDDDATNSVEAETKDWELRAGPFMAVNVGPVAFFAQAGFHTIELDHQDTNAIFPTGALVLGGMGGVY